MSVVRLRLAVIGDPHLGVARGDVDDRLEVDPGRKLHSLSRELLEQTIREINARGDVDATLVLGDITRDSELFNHEIAREVLAALEMPFYLVAGNHDLVRERSKGVSYPDEPYLDRDGFIEHYRGAGLPGDTTRYAVELTGGVVLVVLDSNRTLAELRMNSDPISRQDHGFVDMQQRRWLDSVLRNVRSMGRIPIVAMHHSVTDHSPAEVKDHPLHRFFGYWKAHGARKLRRVLAANQVPLVLSGHIHAQSINTQEGVTNLVTAAAVSYPHAWRLLTLDSDEIHVESFPLASIPSCPNLQERSREWLNEGMGALIEQYSTKNKLMRNLTGTINGFVSSTGWWPRFCDGTLAGFTVDEGLIPKVNPVTSMVYKRIAGLLNDYGTWKQERPDPNKLSLPIDRELP